VVLVGGAALANLRASYISQETCNEL
jgi:hypothetical protein